MDTYETLWGGVTLKGGAGAFSLSTDSILLADFVRLRPDARVCDLGCGSGVLGLLLCGRDARCSVTGVELLESACALARENIARNGLRDRFTLVPGDLRRYRELLPAGGFTHAVSNPPYFSSGPAAPSPERAAARSEAVCPLADLCAAAAWLLAWGGRFSLVYRPERLCDLFCALRAARLEPKRIRFVRHRPDAPVSLALVEARHGGRPGLRFEPDLLLYAADGAPTAELDRIYYRKGGA